MWHMRMTEKVDLDKESSKLLGPYLGYYPKPSKYWFVVEAKKRRGSQSELYSMGQRTGIQITTEGTNNLRIRVIYSTFNHSECLRL